MVQVRQQTLGIRRNAQEPLLQVVLHDERVASLAASVDHLLVCQYRLISGTPVDGCLASDGQASLEQLQEDPLRPAVEAWIGGVDFVAPVEAATASLQLRFSEALDVFRGQQPRMDAAFDGEVFAVNAEGVEAHWLEDMLPAHGCKAAVDVGTGEGVHVADVQPLGRRVRKHHQVEKGPCGIGEVRTINAGVSPDVLPVAFHRDWVVAVCVCRHFRELSLSFRPGPECSDREQQKAPPDALGALHPIRHGARTGAPMARTDSPQAGAEANYANGSTWPLARSIHAADDGHRWWVGCRMAHPRRLVRAHIREVMKWPRSVCCLYALPNLHP